MSKENIYNISFLAKDQAMTILDRHKDGEYYPPHIITRALIVTGDMPMADDSEIQSIIN
jgi:hypothetical protein